MKLRCGGASGRDQRRCERERGGHGLGRSREARHNGDRTRDSAGRITRTLQKLPGKQPLRGEPLRGAPLRGAPYAVRRYAASLPAACGAAAGFFVTNGKIVATSSMIATGTSAPEYEPVASFTFAATIGPTMPPKPHAVKIMP